MSGDDFDPRDPYRKLRPVLAGQLPPGELGCWEIGDGVTLHPVDSHRNLWSVDVCGVSVVTLDADDFPTTADLGVYVQQVIDDLEREAELKSEDDEEEEPRQTERAPTFQ